MAIIQKITPNLWFDSEAEEAAKFYVSIFKNSRIGQIARFGKEGFEFHGKPEGSVMAEKKACVVGSKTSLGFRGKWSLNVLTKMLSKKTVRKNS